MAEIHCRHFNGYKPCGLSETCDRGCAHFDEIRHSVVVVHLGALGAVLRSTALLPAIHRAFPKAKLTWVTQAPADKLLENHPLIDRALTLGIEHQWQLKALQADVVFCIDKSLTAAGVAKSIAAREIRGFKADGNTGAILPANPEARELWSLGLSNQKKFFENTKSENQLVHEALALGEYKREEYSFHFTALEQEMVRTRRQLWSSRNEILIGINTGCSGVIAYKKLTVEYQRKLIAKLQKKWGDRIRVVLLGGREDATRNIEIANTLNVISSPTTEGLRDGMVSVAACDVVITGDSLGMHMAIAQKKWTVAWFGPTCAQEIDLYDRGVKIHTKATCSPCWKRACDKNPMCYDLVDPQEILAGVEKGLVANQWLSSSSKPHSPVTSSSVSRF
jgi:heptosyltransferase II